MQTSQMKSPAQDEAIDDRSVERTEPPFSHSAEHVLTCSSEDYEFSRFAEDV